MNSDHMSTLSQPIHTQNHQEYDGSFEGKLFVIIKGEHEKKLTVIGNFQDNLAVLFVNII